MARQRSSAGEWARVLPDVARLVWRISRDDRVSVPVRLGLGGIVVYLATPFDIVPDWVPFAGVVDDAIVVSLGLRTLLRRVPEHVLVQHWPGDLDVLGRLVGRRIEPPPPELLKASR